jgi:predicted nucleic acid-binding protein
VIVLDTSVISELTRPAPAALVLAWLDSLPAGDVATTAITAAELRYGVARLRGGRRKAELSAAVEQLLADDFRGRVLSFDEPAASHYAEIVADCERLGRTIGFADAEIAAICRSANATLATRNTRDFEETGIELFDPWQAS